MSRAPQNSVAHFDSAVGMVRAVAGALRREPFEGMGSGLPEPLLRALAPLAVLGDRLPGPVRRTGYVRGGWSEAVPTGDTGDVDAEAIAGWLTDMYGDRRHPAAVIGSASGALVHLCAALDAPFLPQTVLVPVRHAGIHPDEPREALEGLREPARRLLDANPDLQLHHMHDPVQDRLMLERMTYFRVKRRRLGDAYRRFLGRTLPRGATLIVSECELTWPVHRAAERHLFQFGAYGGADAGEVHAGSRRIAAHLERCGSHRRSWNPPAPDDERPEAEWGFEPALRDELEALAAERGWRLVRLRFGAPDALSPAVADLHRWWLGERGLDTSRLLAESFILLDPVRAQTTGHVPFWLAFPVEPALERLEAYLASADPPFARVRALLFSHGLDSVGLAPLERWRRIAELVAVDERSWPRDFATFVRLGPELRRLGERYVLPEPLSVATVAGHLRDRDDVAWDEVGAASRS